MRLNQHGILRNIVLEALNVGVNSVTPEALFKRKVRFAGGKLQVSTITLPLNKFHRIFVLGAGKAAGGMAQQLFKLLGEKITGGVVNIPDYDMSTIKSGSVEIDEASHPIPDWRGVFGVKKMLKLTKGVSSKDLVICLLSGGGSALMPLPVEGIDLEEKQKVTGLLLKAGANIRELNAVRKHLSQVKGGRLASKLFPATVLSIIISDVPGDDVGTIASGPTAPDSTTFMDAKMVLERFNVWKKTPVKIRSVIEEGVEGRMPETPKPGDAVFRRVHNEVIADNRTVCVAAENYLKAAGFNTLVLTSTIQGEAREIGKMLACRLKEIRKDGTPIKPPAALICGGETTVKVTGGGKGGRNQELALSAAMLLEGTKNAILAAIGTDGLDGFTDAAGAVADGDTVRRASRYGLNPSTYLENNDSYSFFAKLGDLIKTGPTGTNANDVIIGLVAKPWIRACYGKAIIGTNRLLHGGRRNV